MAERPQSEKHGPAGPGTPIEKSVLRWPDPLETLSDQLLDDDEKLLGCFFAAWGIWLGFSRAAVFVTPERVIIQKLSAKNVAKGEPVSITPEQICRVRAQHPRGFGWGRVASESLINSVNPMLRIRTNDKGRHSLTMIAWGGSPPERQRRGIDALAKWLAKHGF